MVTSVVLGPLCTRNPHFSKSSTAFSKDNVSKSVSTKTAFLPDVSEATNGKDYPILRSWGFHRIGFVVPRLGCTSGRNLDFDFRTAVPRLPTIVVRIASLIRKADQQRCRSKGALFLRRNNRVLPGREIGLKFSALNPFLEVSSG
jgi:hypothetical protein